MTFYTWHFNKKHLWRISTTPSSSGL